MVIQMFDFRYFIFVLLMLTLSITLYIDPFRSKCLTEKEIDAMFDKAESLLKNGEALKARKYFKKIDVSSCDINPTVVISFNRAQEIRAKVRDSRLAAIEAINNIKEKTGEYPEYLDEIYDQLPPDNYPYLEGLYYINQGDSFRLMIRI